MSYRALQWRATVDGRRSTTANAEQLVHVVDVFAVAVLLEKLLELR
jgi:acetolactate synthase regulatory subunit